jgi:hypothetical protein
MLLGTIFTQLRDEKAAAAALLSLGDLKLLAEVEAARTPHDESVGEYVSGAAQRYARLASDEDWLRLMTALERTDRPAATCLAAMVRWSITRDTTSSPGNSTAHACSCGGGNGSCHDQA